MRRINNRTHSREIHCNKSQRMSPIPIPSPHTPKPKTKSRKKLTILPHIRSLKHLNTQILIHLPYNLHRISHSQMRISIQMCCYVSF